MAWIRVLAAVAVYLVIALLTSALIRRRGSNLREMESRSSSTVLVMGAVANLLVLGAVLLFVVLVDQQPLGALGLDLGGRDALFIAVTATLTVGRRQEHRRPAGAPVVLRPQALRVPANDPRCPRG
jgi:hypothetical protein